MIKEIQEAYELLKKGALTKEEFDSIKVDLLAKKTSQSDESVAIEITYEFAFCDSCGSVNLIQYKKCLRCKEVPEKPYEEKVPIQSNDKNNFDLFLQSLFDTGKEEQVNEIKSHIKSLQKTYINSPLLSYVTLLLETDKRFYDQSYFGFNISAHADKVVSFIETLSPDAEAEHYLDSFIAHLRFVYDDKMERMKSFSEATLNLPAPTLSYEKLSLGRGESKIENAINEQTENLINEQRANAARAQFDEQWQSGQGRFVQMQVQYQISAWEAIFFLLEMEDRFPGRYLTKEIYQLRINILMRLIVGCTVAGVFDTTIETIEENYKGRPIADELLSQLAPSRNKNYERKEKKRLFTTKVFIIAVLAVGLLALVLKGNDILYYLSNDSAEAGTDETVVVTDELRNNSIPNFAKFFSGSINNKYQIEMILKNVSGALSGNYRYAGKQVALELTGTIDKSGNISLREYDSKGQNTGIFTGQLLNGTLRGQWSTPDKQKTYSFTVNEIQGGQSVYSLLQGKWQSEDDPKAFKIFDKFTLIDVYEGNTEGDREEYVLSNECLNDSDKGSAQDRDKYISLLKSDMCFHIDHIDNKSLSLVYMGRGNFLNYRKVGIEDIASGSSTSDGFHSTPTVERYKMIKVQVPNHDEAGTTSELEVIGPVEGMYISKSGDKSRSIQINYDGDKIYILHWNDSENAKREEAYVTSKGYLAFGSEEFEYDRYGETVTEVKNLSLVERYTGQVFVWNTEWQGD